MSRLIPPLILFAIVAVYARTLTAPALAWDDDVNIFKNAFYLEHNLRGLWTTAYYGMYIPVTSTIWGWLFAAFHGSALPFRLLNLSLVMADTALLAGLLRRWTRAGTAQAWLAAGLFALHPLQVESVAWISGGRDLLAAFWVLLALTVYGRGARVWPALLFALALLSKPSVVALPFAWLVYLLLFSGSPRAWKTAFVCLAMSVVTTLIASGSQVTSHLPTVDWWLRPLVMLDSYGFYLKKLVWPFDLAVDYGRVPPDYSLTYVALALVGVALCWRKPVALLWFLVLLPTSGLFTFAFQEISTVADRYMLLGMPVVAYLLLGVDRRVLALLLIACSVVSFRRAEVWTGNEVFFRDMQEKNPASYSAAIGIAGVDCGKPDARGLEELKPAFAARPNDYLATSAEVYCLAQLGRLDEVPPLLARLSEAPSKLEKDPSAAASLFNTLGVAEIKRKSLQRALAELCKAVEIFPANPVYQANLDLVAKAYLEAGWKISCPAAMTTTEFLRWLPRVPR